MTFNNLENCSAEDFEVIETINNMRYLGRLRAILPKSLYITILRHFLEKDMKGLAEMIERLVKEVLALQQEKVHMVKKELTSRESRAIEELKEVFSDESSYRGIYNCFQAGDTVGLVDIIKQLVKQIKELNNRVEATKNVLQHQLVKANEREEKYYNEAESLRKELMGKEAWKCKRIKDLYLSGMTLRAIEREPGINWSRSTIRRRLEQMGVEIRPYRKTK